MIEHMFNSSDVSSEESILTFTQYVRDLKLDSKKECEILRLASDMLANVATERYVQGLLSGADAMADRYEEARNR